MTRLLLFGGGAAGLVGIVATAIIAQSPGDPIRYVRNGADTKLARVTQVESTALVRTQTYRGQTVEVYDCTPETVGPRFFGARKDTDAEGATLEQPLLANVAPEKVAGRCIQFTPTAWTDSQGRFWYLWKCIATGTQACGALDHPQYLGADKADLIARAASLGDKALSKLEFFCALDPQGCTSEGQPAPCRKPVAEIPTARRPPEAEWFACSVYAAPFDEL